MSTLAQALEILEAFAMVLFSSTLAGFKLTTLPVASVVIFVYDYTLTFSAETLYIWSNPLGLSSVLFFLTRYPPVFDSAVMLTHVFAKLTMGEYEALYKVHVCSYAVSLLISNVILFLRTVALWNKNKQIILSLTIFLGTTAALAGYSMDRYLTGLKFELATGPVPGFFVLDNENNLYIPYALLLGFETVVLVLTLMKASGSRKFSVLHKTLYHDSLKYYFLLFGVSVVNLVALAFGRPTEIRPIFTAVHRIIHSICSGRIILNIHEAAFESKRAASETTSKIQTAHGGGTFLDGSTALFLYLDAESESDLAVHGSESFLDV